jgi:hypothetical protein
MHCRGQNEAKKAVIFLKKNQKTFTRWRTLQVINRFVIRQ